MANIQKKFSKLGKQYRKVKRKARKGLKVAGDVAGGVGAAAQLAGVATGQPELIALGATASGISGEAKMGSKLLKKLP